MPGKRLLYTDEDWLITIIIFIINILGGISAGQERSRTGAKLSQDSPIWARCPKMTGDPKTPVHGIA